LTYRVGRCLLQSLLNDAGLDQVSLARELNVSKQQINKYTTNKQRMSLQVAKNVATILHCGIDDLYEWVEVGDLTSGH